MDELKNKETQCAEPAPLPSPALEHPSPIHELIHYSLSDSGHIIKKGTSPNVMKVVFFTKNSNPHPSQLAIVYYLCERFNRVR